MFPIGNVGAKRVVGAAVLRVSVVVFNTSFFSQMPRKKFLTLEEAVEMVLSDDSAQAADVVLLPPPNADDILTDEEEGDSDIAVVASLPNDVAGEVEVHTADDDECGGTLQEAGPPRPKKASRNSPNWRRTTQYSEPIVETQFQPLRVTHAELVDEEPFNLFARLLNMEIVGLITEESNRYAKQQNDHSVNITEKDILDFVAILFVSGYHKLPRSDLYWSKDEDLSVPLVASTMSRAKFRLIKRYIHVSDSENLEKGDKMAKIRPLLRLVNSSLQQFGIFSENLSVDEQMVPYFGRHSCKMFIKGKPIRFGYKEWILCSSSGYPFNIDIYCGKKDDDDMNVPLGTRVVLSAVKCIDVPTNHVIFMDNFFTSHALLQELKERGFRATGTVREARLKKCPLQDSKELARQSRGTFDFLCDGDVLAVKWNDNKCVCVATNYDDIHPTATATRYSQKERKRVPVPQPRVIQQYNKHMGGVDLLDRFISDYRPCLHGKKWYWPLLSNTLVTLRVAAWRLYTELGSQPPLDQLQFTRLIVQGLLTKKLVTRERPGPSGALVFHSKEGHGHHLVPLGKQSRCRQCNKNTRMKCQMCSVALHIHCSVAYHEGK